MKIQKVIIENVKNFKNRTEVELSNYNVFIGKNGSGKSNLAKSIFQAVDTPTNHGVGLVTFQGDRSRSSVVTVEVLLRKEDIHSLAQGGVFNALQQSPLRSQLQNDTIFGITEQPNLTLQKGLSNNGHVFAIKEYPLHEDINTARGGVHNELYLRISNELRKKVLFIPDTRDLPGQFQYDQNYANLPMTTNNFMTFYTALKLDRRQQKTYDKIIELACRIVPSIEDLLINPVGNIVGLGERGSSYEIPAQEISKGTREVLVLISMIAMAKEGSVVIIEEPEVHLHPKAVKEFREIIRELISKNNLQVIITTHNPDFLEGLIPGDPETKGMKFVREIDGSSSIQVVTNTIELGEAMNEV